MKSKNKLSLSLFIIVFAYYASNAQTENKNKKESVLVTFECEPCTKRNKFKISGLENHVFVQAQFPIDQKLKPGEYEMTYWQNKVQQIHLPFSVDPETKNVIVVKE